MPIINLEAYTVPELILFTVGCYLWVMVYVVYIRSIIKQRFIEMPVFAAASNLGWEFVWGFIPPPTDMGLLLVWAYRLWFLIDIFIFWGVYRYGDKQISIPELKRFFRPLIVFTALSWGLFYYFFKAQGFDTVIGANSAYIAQILISILYIVLILRLNDLSLFSYPVAWMRSVGTGLISVFMFIHYSDNHMLHLLCLLCALLDATFIIIFSQKRSKNKVA